MDEVLSATLYDMSAILARDDRSRSGRLRPEKRNRGPRLAEKWSRTCKPPRAADGPRPRRGAMLDRLDASQAALP